MKINKSLSEFNLSDFNLEPHVLDYSFNFNDDYTVARIIFDYLTSKPGFIRHKRSVELSNKQRKAYLSAVHKIVAKGAPLEIFITAFSPKINNPSFTNNLSFPDMADCLSLLHLHLIAKEIRSIYDYGFRFIIGYKGSLYQDIFGWNRDTVNSTLIHLETIKNSIEKVVGIRNVVEFVDILDLVEKEGDYLKNSITLEYNDIKEDYLQNKNSFYKKKIDSWVKDFSKAVDSSRFPSEEEKKIFLIDHSCLQLAFKYKAYSGGEFDLGITNSFPNSLLATVRGMGKNLSFQLNPHFRFHSHQRLILLNENNEWETFIWNEINPDDLEPVFINDFKYPFYFIKK